MNGARGMGRLLHGRSVRPRGNRALAAPRRPALTRAAQVSQSCFEHLIAVCTNARDSRSHEDLRLKPHTLQLSSVGVTHVMAREADR